MRVRDLPLMAIGRMSMLVLDVIARTPSLADITLTQMRVVMLVASYECHEDDLEVSDIARILKIPKSTASRCVSILAGYTGKKPVLVELTPHPTDRRRKIVEPAKALKKLREKNLEAIRIELDELWTGISRKQRSRRRSIKRAS